MGGGGAPWFPPRTLVLTTTRNPRRSELSSVWPAQDLMGVGVDGAEEALEVLQGAAAESGD